MALTREKKAKIIEGLKEKIEKQKAAVFVDFSKLESKFLFRLREELQKSNCLLQVAKKTLLKKALEELKEKNLSEKIESLRGQLAIVFGFGDEIIPAKISYQFTQENENLKILGGIFENKFVDKERVIELAQLPSREELRVRVVGSLSSPIFNFINVLKDNIKGLIYVISRIKSES